MTTPSKLRRAALATIGAAALLLGLAFSSSGAAAPGDPTPTEGHFDPTRVALGLEADEDLAELRAAQDALAAALPDEAVSLDGRGGDQDPVGRRAAAEVDEASAALSAWNDALDELYDRVAARPASEQLREEWLACIADAGYPVAHPSELEAYADAMDDLTDLNDASDRCYGAQDDALSAALADEFPEWQDDNAEVIEAYADALGLD